MNSLFIFINSKELKRYISDIAVTSSRGILWASLGSHIFLIIHVRLCALIIMPYSSYCNAIEFSSITKAGIRDGIVMLNNYGSILCWNH